MEDTFVCPNCTGIDAFFNGVNYVCPDCEYEWRDDLIEDDEKE